MTKMFFMNIYWINFEIENISIYFLKKEDIRVFKRRPFAIKPQSVLRIGKISSFTS